MINTNKSNEFRAKAEKYVRKNSTYYGNDTFALKMDDWLYFVEGVTNEAIKQERDRNIELLELLGCFVDDEECQLDHHGYCQTHSWMETSECPNKKANKLLTLSNKESEE